jgi:hypothetical protein
MHQIVDGLTNEITSFMAKNLLRRWADVSDDRILIEDGDEVLIQSILDQRTPMRLVQRQERCGLSNVGCVSVYEGDCD